MTRAVIFDLDDTLYPERAFAFSGFAAVAQAFTSQLGDADRATARMRELFDTEHRRRIFDQLLGELGLAESAAVLVPRMIETYRGHTPSITLFPDAERAIDVLRGRFKLGLITDGPARMQRAKIEALSIIDSQAGGSTEAAQDEPRGTGDSRRSDAGLCVFDMIVVTDELGPGFSKPHPRAFELMAERFGVAHRECTYVADNPAKDFVAPNRLGWRTIRVARADGVYRDAATAVDGTPQQEIASLDDLPDML